SLDLIFFFSSRRRHTRFSRDWSSDVCSSDLAGLQEEDIFAPTLNAIRNRAPWLLVNLVTASTAAFVASRFEGTVSHIVVLAFLKIGRASCRESVLNSVLVASSTSSQRHWLVD